MTCINSLPISEINSSDPAISMDLHSSGLDIIRAIGPSCEVA